MNFDTIHNRLGTDAEKYELLTELFGRDDIIPAWVADTDFETAPVVQKALQSRVAHELYGYGSPRHSDTLDAVRWWMREEHGLECSEESILFAPSTVISICMAIQACTKEGEGVVVFSPVYGPFLEKVPANNRDLVEIPLLCEGGRYDIDFESFEKEAQKDDVKLLLLCSPHNPVGRVWEPEVLQRLLDICLKNNVVIFSDEIHSDIVYPPHTHTPFLSLPRADQCVMAAHSIGKTFNCSGLYASFVMIPNPELRKKVECARVASHIFDLSILGKVALRAAFSPEGQVYKRELIGYLTDTVDMVVNRFAAEFPAVKVTRPEATFLIWLDFRGLGLSTAELLHTLVDEARVGLSGGAFFGEPGKGCFRLNIGAPRSLINEIVTRIITALRDK